jgi:glutamyl-tRNA reductase
VSLGGVQRAMAARKSRPLLLIDLAMPRDIDAAVAGLENVFLYNLDDLAKIAATNRRARSAEAEAGRLALAPRIDALWAVLQTQLVLGTDTSRADAEEILFRPTPSAAPAVPHFA